MVNIRVRRKGNADAMLNKIKDRFKKSGKVKVGFPAGKQSQEILERAVYNNFGTRDIPERNFMQLGISQNKRSIEAASSRIAKRIVTGTITPNQGINQLGLYGVGLIQKAITDLSSPANAASTIEAKGSSNPLIDTGEMRQSVTHEVV